MNVKEQLKRDEGFRGRPYQDTAGKTTVGYGRNLDDVPLSEDEASFLLDNDIETATAKLIEAFPWSQGIDAVRFSALVNMTFNIGIGGLARFKNFLLAMQQGNWEMAKVEMLDSKWAEQVGPRAHRLAIQIETGVWQ